MQREIDSFHILPHTETEKETPFPLIDDILLTILTYIAYDSSSDSVHVLSLARVSKQWLRVTLSLSHLEITSRLFSDCFSPFDISKYKWLISLKISSRIEYTRQFEGIRTNHVDTLHFTDILSKLRRTPPLDSNIKTLYLDDNCFIHVTHIAYYFRALESLIVQSARHLSINDMGTLGLKYIRFAKDSKDYEPFQFKNINVLNGVDLIEDDFNLITRYDGRTNGRTGRSIIHFKLLDSSHHSVECYLKNGKYDGFAIWNISRVDSRSCYKGEINDILSRHGKGTTTEISSKGIIRILKGHYVNGEFIRGTMISANEYLYEGEFVNGKYQGEGILTHLKRGCWTIRGQFKEGRANGEVLLTKSSGSTYKGGMKDGLRHGYGKFTNSKGTDVYLGEFDNDHFHGRGTYTLCNKIVVDASWEKSHARGELKITLLDKHTFFKGCASHKKINGKGTWVLCTPEEEENEIVLCDGIFKDNVFMSGYFLSSDRNTVFMGSFDEKDEFKGSIYYKKVDNNDDNTTTTTTTIDLLKERRQYMITVDNLIQ
jgi:hypothetical protein